MSESSRLLLQQKYVDETMNDGVYVILEETPEIDNKIIRR